MVYGRSKDALNDNYELNKGRNDAGKMSML